MPRQQKKFKPGKFYQINQYIKVPQMRVVDEKAGQVGVMTKDQALAAAREAGLDLVLVAPSANPPVAKIIDFAKFKYLEKQKNLSGLKKARKQDIKEIYFTPFIAEGDFNTRIRRAIEFLEDGDKVQLVVKFTGRQITRKDFGDNVLKKATESLSDYATVEREPSLRGKLLVMVLSPLKKSKKKIDSTESDTDSDN